MSDTPPCSHDTFWLEANDGTRVHITSFLPDTPRAVVLVFHGYAEHAGRFEETMETLAESGFACYAPDHRGHGRTGPLAGYMPEVNTVLADVHHLRDHVDSAHPGLPVFMIGHSMGGLITMRYLQKYGSEGIAGAIPISSGVLVPPDIPEFMQTLSAVLGRFTPRLPVQAFFAPEKATRVPEEQAKLHADPLIYKGWIRAGTGWALLRAMHAAMSEMSRVTAPLLIVHGTGDVIVLPEASQRIHAEVASEDNTLLEPPGVFHDVFHEPEGPEILQQMIDWMNARAA